MIAVSQVKAHFMKVNCFLLHTLKNVIFLHILLHSPNFTDLLCVIIDINILHNVVPVICMFKCVMMYKCDHQLHYQDNFLLLFIIRYLH